MHDLLSLASRLLVLGCFAVAATDLQEARAQADSRPLVVCSTTQIADLTRQLCGDRWRVHCVLAPGQDPHLYQIKSGDAEVVAQADLCLENGWGLEGKNWMRTLAENADKPIVTCARGVRPLQIEEDGRAFHDPHAWFTPANAAVYARNIATALIQADSDGEAAYRARLRLLLGELRVLHHWVLEEVNQIPVQQRVLVTSHDAFGYFCREYGFRAAAPAGWSTRAEVGGGMTPKRRREAVDSIRSFGVKAIFVETSVNESAIRELARDAGVRVGGKLYSDSMGSAGSAGESYQGMLRENVLTIVESLK